jgi:hypothetical protein
VVSSLVKDWKKNKEERRKNFSKILVFESGLNYDLIANDIKINEANNEDLTMKDIFKIVNDSIKDENMN